MRKNAFAAGALPRTPLGEFTALPRLTSWIFWGRGGKRVGSGRGGKQVAKGNGGREKGREGNGWCDLGEG